MPQQQVEQVWLDGGLVAAGEARVGVFDSLFQHGFGLFETMRAYGGPVFRLADHLRRLGDSAGALGIRMPFDSDALARAVAQTIQANRLTDARVRIAVSRGDLSRPAEGPQPAPTVVVTAAPMTPHPPEAYRRGLTVAVAQVRHNETNPLLGHKVAGNYATRLWVLRQAQLRGCGEALMFTFARRLASGTISNVFLVREGAVRTPPLGLNILPGITRKVVLELCRQAGIPAEEAELTIDDLLDADEVFLTNSIMEIMPVCRVEAKALGAEEPGEITRRLSGHYRDAVAAECGEEGGSSHEQTPGPIP